jgi:hypothetical protein
LAHDESDNLRDNNLRDNNARGRRERIVGEDAGHGERMVGEDAGHGERMVGEDAGHGERMVGEVGGRRRWERFVGEDGGREDGGRGTLRWSTMRDDNARRQRKIGRQCKRTLQEDVARGRERGQ